MQLEASRDYLIGLSVGSSRDPFGDSEQKVRAGVIWAFQLGRFRFATSGAVTLPDPTCSALRSIHHQSRSPYSTPFALPVTWATSPC